MENEVTAKRSLILVLVIATVAIFIGSVWLIATYFPWSQLGIAGQGRSSSTPQVEKNCTYPVLYWVEHPELYPPQIVLGSKVYQANDIREVLTYAGQDPSAQLQAQLVGAFLNISLGADQDLIETTIFQAYSWLVQHPLGQEVSVSDLETGARYYSMLEAYNLGLAGVPACGETSTVTITDTPTISVTPTIYSTIESSDTPTATPSETPSPTYQPATPIFTVVVSTQTSIPTTQKPGGQVPTATRTNVPPSKTPIKTTEVPIPTRTSAPSTPTFTPPPPPSQTYTPPPLPTPEP